MAHKRGRLVREPETGQRRQKWGTIEENAHVLDQYLAGDTLVLRDRPR